MESLEIDPHIYDQLIFNTYAKEIQKKKIVFSTIYVRIISIYIKKRTFINNSFHMQTLF